MTADTPHERIASAVARQRRSREVIAEEAAGVNERLEQQRQERADADSGENPQR